MTADPTHLSDLPWVHRGDDRPGTTRAADRGFGWQRHGITSGTDSGMPGGTDTGIAARTGTAGGTDDEVRPGTEDGGRPGGTARGARRAAVRAGRHAAHAAAVPLSAPPVDEPVPTHHIRVPQRAATTAPAVPADDDRAAAVPPRAAGRMRDWAAELRFVSETPDSLRGHLHHARHAAYNGSNNQAVRRANLTFFYVVTAPLLSVLYLFAWAFLMRLHRAATFAAVVLVVAPVLNTVPVVHWLVADWLDVTWWVSR